MTRYPGGPQWQRRAMRPEPVRFGGFLGPVLAVVIIIIGFGVLGLIGLAQQHSASDPQLASDAAPASAPAPASASAATPAPVNTRKVLFQQSGAGELTTAYFATGPEWQLQWSYDCGLTRRGYSWWSAATGQM